MLATFVIQHGTSNLAYKNYDRASRWGGFRLFCSIGVALTDFPAPILPQKRSAKHEISNSSLWVTPLIRGSVVTGNLHYFLTSKVLTFGPLLWCSLLFSETENEINIASWSSSLILVASYCFLVNFVIHQFLSHSFHCLCQFIILHKISFCIFTFL